MANEYAVNQADLVSVADAIRAKGETTEQLVFPGGFVSAIHDISTGVALNFQVVGGTAAPANPAENTIWVSTDQAITGWVFSHNQPDSPSEGMVWITVDTKSDAAFDALVDNTLMVYPVLCKHYISGEWVLNKAHIFQNSSWVQFSNFALYIFKSGLGALVELKKWAQKNASVTISNDSIECSYTSDGGYHIVSIQTVNTIDVSNFKTLNIEANITGVNGANDENTRIGRFGLYNGSSLIAEKNFAADNALVKYTIDISSITGSYYVLIERVIKGNIYNIWLE